MTGSVRYELLEFDLDAHEFAIAIVVPASLAAGMPLTLRMPAWIPGSYLIRDFARHITEISAMDGRGGVPLYKTDKQTWRVDAYSGDLTVRYRVYAFDLSVRGAYLDRSRGYFNGACLFPVVSELQECAWSVRIPRPIHDATADWRVATTMQRVEVDDRGFGVYAGHGYAELIDHPVEIAAFSTGSFTVAGVPHRFAVTDAGRFDMSRLLSDMARICAEHVRMFDSLPATEYLFLVLATADGYGGLEHADSTSLICKRSDLPGADMSRPDKGYRQFLALCSHEYFHLWNVKRIRPQRFLESGLDAEVHTELLWAFEGITSYYDELALVRAGVLTAEEYLDLFAATVTRLLRNPGRRRQSLAASSFDAWTKFYKQDENAPNAIVSYYTKGALVAFGLDMALREASNGSLCLDDLMRRLWQQYGLQGRGIAERGIERELAALLGDPLDEFFNEYVYGTAELPLAAWFATVGVDLRTRPAQGADDLGGYDADAADAGNKVALGARYEAEAGGLRLTQVLHGGAAQAAGLAPRDLLLAVDGERVTAANLVSLLERARPGPVEVHLFRRDRLQLATLPVMDAPSDTCVLKLLPDEQLTTEVLARRAAWLGSARPGLRERSQ